jgi:hypothetical protein
MAFMTVRRFWWLLSVALFLLVVAAIFFPTNLSSAWNGLISFLTTLNLSPDHVFIGTVVIFAGVVAYTFKKISKYWYGICEVVFASLTAVGIAAEPSQGKWLKYAGTAYIVARGIANISDGQDDRAKKRELKRANTGR